MDNELTNGAWLSFTALSLCLQNPSVLLWCLAFYTVSLVTKCTIIFFKNASNSIVVLQTKTFSDLYTIIEVSLFLSSNN